MGDVCYDIQLQIHHIYCYTTFLELYRLYISNNQLWDKPQGAARLVDR